MLLKLTLNSTYKGCLNLTKAKITGVSYTTGMEVCVFLKDIEKFQNMKTPFSVTIVLYN